MNSTPDQTLPVGTRLAGGRYRIVRFLSSGGFGCTYEGVHEALGKRVAIKEFFVKNFCNRDTDTNHISIGTTNRRGLVEKLRRKFIAEAQAICNLEHPNIVHVHDVFEDNGTAYYVMDYIAGPSLSDLVKRDGQLPEKQALKYIRQIAEALRYVHSHKCLHLDIKPGNIMISPEDNAILIDFGAAKQYDEENGENTSTLVGKTPGYAPAEQMSDNVVKFTAATDIYALGATLYKTLTGRTPIDATLRASGEELPPMPATISHSTRNAVDEAMKMNRNHRPQTIDEFLAFLDAPRDVTEDDRNDYDAVVVITDDTEETEANKDDKGAKGTKGAKGAKGNESKKGKDKPSGGFCLLVTFIVLFLFCAFFFSVNLADCSHSSSENYDYAVDSCEAVEEEAVPVVAEDGYWYGDEPDDFNSDDYPYEDDEYDDGYYAE